VHPTSKHPAMVVRARNAFRAETPGTDAFIWPNNIYVSAKVIGGAVWEVFGRLKWMDRQRFAMTATGDELERHGADYGISRKPASYSQGNVVVVADTWPLTVAQGTVFTRSDGVQFTSTLAKDIGKYSLSATIPVVCNVAGKSGNTTYGAPLSTNIAHLTAVNVDDVGLGQGADQETDDQLRERILARKRYPPHGGADFDYIAWAKELPGVTRAFVKANAFGRGTVGIWFLMDDTYVAGIPQAADVAAVQAHIDGLKPTTAIPIVQAPVADCIDIVIQDLKPDTQAVREAVAAELQTMFRRETVPSIPGDLFTLSRSWIEQAVSNATGERSNTVFAPSTDITFGPGIMPCLRSVTFTKSSNTSS
jgi:uncharacterized phage protein gp47/JayE